jgi:hypothetical protein
LIRKELLEIGFVREILGAGRFGPIVWTAAIEIKIAYGRRVPVGTSL